MLYRTPPGFSLGSLGALDNGIVRYERNGGTEQIRNAPYVPPSTSPVPATTAYVPPPSAMMLVPPASNGAPVPYRAAPNIPKWYAPAATVPAAVAPTTLVPARPVSQPAPPAQLRPVTTATSAASGSGGSSGNGYSANGEAEKDTPGIPWLLIATIAGSMLF